MNVPPLLLGAALLFWGQQTGLWLVAVPMALILEAPRLMRRRWELSREDFIRVGDLCTLFFAALVVYLYLTRETLRALSVVLAWLPLSLLPLVAAQRLSVAGRIDLGAFFWSLRRLPAGTQARSVDISYPYFVLCVLSAGAANSRTPVFYAGLFVLSAWALWSFRPRHRPVWRWAACVLAAGALGLAGHKGLSGLQLALEKSAENVLFGKGEARTDPYQSRTAIGSIGKISQSGDIVLRVRAKAKPGLLRTASYNHYANAQWFAREPGFRPVPPGAGARSWRLSPPPKSAEELRVIASWPKGQGILPLPLDAALIEGLSAESVSSNRLGAVTASETPAVVDYAVRFGPGAARDAAPDAFDLEVPAAERAAFTQLAGELQLKGKKPADAVRAIERFFTDNFRYTIFQETSSPEPLRDFLYKTRAGHCEYFATATVLLLRAAGIPARYAGGYSIQEFSRLEKAYVVRQRHAHAWTMVWVDGAWRDLDTTPMSWPEIERGRASRFEPLSDFASMARLRAALWRVELTQAGGAARGRAAWLLLAALLAWILWKLSGLVKASRRADGSESPAPVVSGTDSEFYAIEERLGRTGLGRRPWEAPAAWVDRIAAELGSEKAAPLRSILSLHYRYRFDPKGITEDERRILKAEARSWLKT